MLSRRAALEERLPPGGLRGRSRARGYRDVFTPSPGREPLLQGGAGKEKRAVIRTVCSHAARTSSTSGLGRKSRLACSHAARTSSASGLAQRSTAPPHTTGQRIHAGWGTRIAPRATARFGPYRGPPWRQEAPASGRRERAANSLPRVSAPRATGALRAFGLARGPEFGSSCARVTGNR